MISAATQHKACDADLLAGLETPCYLLEPESVLADLAALRLALGTPVVVSVKASPVLDLLVRCNQGFFDGIEIASLGELNLTIGRLSVPRYVNTPALDETLIAAALACKATLVVDSAFQLALIERVMQKPALQGREAPAIVLRLNAASLLDSPGLQADHFGMDLATLRRELLRLSPLERGPRVMGLHVFAGSHSFAHSGLALVQRLLELMPQLRAWMSGSLELVMIGAGLPAGWRSVMPAIDAYASALRDLQGLVHVVHEAGRAVFAGSGRFVTRIVGLKTLNGESLLVCDGGMAQCFTLAQTEQFVKQWRAPLLVPAQARPATAEVSRYRVVGNSCNRADVLGQLQTAVEPKAGDCLVFEQCGAYHSYSPTGFLNLRPARHYIAS